MSKKIQFKFDDEPISQLFNQAKGEEVSPAEIVRRALSLYMIVKRPKYKGFTLAMVKSNEIVYDFDLEKL